MMPYIEQPSLHVGPFTVHAFGVLVACAVLVGVEIVRHRAKAAGLPEEGVATFVTWILAGGFVGAHLVDRLIYFPRETLADPLSSSKHRPAGLPSTSGTHQASRRSKANGRRNAHRFQCRHR
jgi:prolipoprotein diacylglyceryltransferase